MLEGIDLRTVIIYLSLGNFFILLFLLFFQRNEENGLIRRFALAKLCQSVAWMLLGFRGIIPALFSIYIGNALLFYGFGLEVLSLLFFNIVIPKKTMRSFVVLTIVYVLLFTSLGVVFESSRIIFASSSIAIMFVLGGYVLIKKKNIANVSKPMGAINMVYGMVLMARGVAPFLYTNEFRLYTDNAVQQLSFLSVFLVLLVNAIGYLMMQKWIVENELIEQSKMLSKLNTDKNVFISVISHDLKNPILNVVQLSELMKELIRNKEPIDESFVNHVVSSAQTSLNLLESLMSWTTINSGAIKIKKQPLSLYGLIADCIEVCQAQAENKEILLINNIGENTQLLADEEMMKTVFRNFITNAIKFSHKKGKVEINEVSDNKSVVLEIKDYGIGMDKKTAELLFNSKLTSLPGTDQEVGTGMGLLICKQFLDLHNGAVDVKSVLGSGSSFYISIPS